MSSDPRFEIDVNPKSVQRLSPTNERERFEGIDFSPLGNTIAIATADTNSVLLFRRNSHGCFDGLPCQKIGEPSALDYPHDVSFSLTKDSEILAVSQRVGSIAFYQKRNASDNYDPEPVFNISGPETKLAFSDGVAFVPPYNEYLAACNLERATIAFFRRSSLSPLSFDHSPEFELKHSSVFNPDGLAFSRSGKWLAIANHGNQTVSIFQRRNQLFSGCKLSYGPEPMTVIDDMQLHYPHSVAFTPRTNHLVVTSAGANYFSVYRPRRNHFGMRWSQLPVAQVIVHDDDEFRKVNTANKMEGGPKGVAIYRNSLAVCSPQIGVKIYSFHEGL